MVTLGDHVQLNLKGATGALINGQKGMMDVNDLVGIKIAEKVYVQPEIITFEGLHSGLYQGKKVRIDNVFFPQANGVRTFEGNWAISNDHSGATVTTYSGAEFSRGSVAQWYSVSYWDCRGLGTHPASDLCSGHQKIRAVYNSKNHRPGACGFLFYMFTF